MPLRRARFVVLALLACAGALDFGIGRGVSMSLLYASTIAFASWRLGRNAGFVTAAAVVALACLGATRDMAPVAASVPVLAWNLAANSLGAVMLAILAAALRSTIEHERTLASVDALTGALNRAAFFDRLEREVAAARRSRDRRLLACVDLDGFKALNDGYGHGAGDRLLAEFASGVMAGLDAGEAIARVGGDEFALLLALAPGEGAAQRAGRLQHWLSDLLNQSEIRVTCSSGVVALPGPDDAAIQGEALLAAADAAMYEVKRSGRDGVRVAAPAAPGAAASRPIRNAA
ncbi:GGDEF domain-containing protein [Sphingomonas sp.]|uniref:GGDEF domain-containing protein n=1 Tax=Sphingomonas sp. TaxID=28214 RepID=UPI003AFF7293